MDTVQVSVNETRTCPAPGVVGFILHIINPCAGSLSLYSTSLIPVRGRGVCSLVNRETLLELRSELRSDALTATTIDFSRIQIHDSLRVSRVF